MKEIKKRFKKIEISEESRKKVERFAGIISFFCFICFFYIMAKLYTYFFRNYNNFYILYFIDMILSWCKFIRKDTATIITQTNESEKFRISFKTFLVVSFIIISLIFLAIKNYLNPIISIDINKCLYLLNRINADPRTVMIVQTYITLFFRIIQMLSIKLKLVLTYITSVIYLMIPIICKIYDVCCICKLNYKNKENIKHLNSTQKIGIVFLSIYSLQIIYSLIFKTLPIGCIFSICFTFYKIWCKEDKNYFQKIIIISFSIVFLNNYALISWLLLSSFDLFLSCDMLDILMIKEFNNKYANKFKKIILAYSIFNFLFDFNTKNNSFMRRFFS